MADKELHFDLTEKSRVRLVARVKSSAEKLLKKIGALLVADSRQAFQDQQFGDIQWLPTYPKQQQPTLNVAWTLKDFLAGRSKPDARRFQNRPAGVATGQEPWQIAAKPISEDEIELGTMMEGAEGMQLGNKEGSIPITADARARMNDWLFQGKRRRVYFPEFISAAEMRQKFGIHWKGNKKGKRSKDGYETITEQPNAKYLPKLRKFLNPTVTSYEIKGYARPFIGITAKRSEQLAELLQNHIAGGK